MTRGIVYGFRRRQVCLSLHSTVPHKEERSCVLQYAWISDWTLFWAWNLCLLKTQSKFCNERFLLFFFAQNVSVYKPLLFDFTMLLYERLKDSDLLLLNPDAFYYKCFIIFLGIHELSIYTVKQVLLQIYFPFLFQIGYHINFWNLVHR